MMMSCSRGLTTTTAAATTTATLVLLVLLLFYLSVGTSTISAFIVVNTNVDKVNTNNVGSSTSTRTRTRTRTRSQHHCYYRDIHKSTIIDRLLLSSLSSSLSSASSPNTWILKAEEALTRCNYLIDNDNDNNVNTIIIEDEDDLLSSVEFYLMNAVQEIQMNGSTVMNSPQLLNGFEQLFRMKIKLSSMKLIQRDQEQEGKEHENGSRNDNNIPTTSIKLSMAQDRIGLASLLSDQGKYQEAVIELEKAVEVDVDTVDSVDDGKNSNQKHTILPPHQYDKALSLLFRTRASICDWNNHNYQQSCFRLRKSTQESLSLLLVSSSSNNNVVPDTPVPVPVPVPAVHPFEALSYPCLSLQDSTSIAHAYAMRAIRSAATTLQKTTTTTAASTTPTTRTSTQTQPVEEFTPLLPWTNLNDKFLSRETNKKNGVPFVKAYSSKSKSNVHHDHNDDDGDGTRIRIGYLSPDFTGKHPLAFLMQDVFQFHNTNTNAHTRFEIVLYSLDQEDDGSPEVTKIINSTVTTHSSNTNSHWKVLNGPVPAMVQTILDDQLDILIDLCGYTGTSLVADIMAYLRLIQLQQQQSELQLQSELEERSKDSRSNNDIMENKINQNKMMIHVSYMGFPGSSGSPYIDYLIADQIVIPPTNKKIRKQYTENILYMPHCYFVNSHKYLIASSRNNTNENGQPERDDYGLPSKGNGFVFCCHSRPDKIDPNTFTTWIKALKRTRIEGQRTYNNNMYHAVLWILRSGKGNSTTSNSKKSKSNDSDSDSDSDNQCRMEMNLRRCAENIMKSSNEDNENDGGVPSSTTTPATTPYLIFCDQVSRKEHLHRLSIGADLFLDTPAYNAHTVGCDCLSCGVPMISLLRKNDNDNKNNDDDDNNNNDNNDDHSNDFKMVPTDKLASRVGASLLKSAISSSSSSSSSLSDVLIVSTMKEYEDTMVQCARDSIDLHTATTNASSMNTTGDTDMDTDTDTDTDGTSTKFSSFRQQLIENLDIAPLWDTQRWVRNLETGLQEMIRLRDQQQSQYEHLEHQHQQVMDMDIYVIDDED